MTPDNSGLFLRDAFPYRSFLLSGQLSLGDLPLMTSGLWRNVLNIGVLFFRRTDTLLTLAWPGLTNDLQFYLIILWRKYQFVQITSIYLKSVSKPTNVYITYRIITLKFRSSFFASKRLCFIDVYSNFIFAFFLPFFAF